MSIHEFMNHVCLIGHWSWSAHVHIERIRESIDQRSDYAYVHVSDTNAYVFVCVTVYVFM